MCRWIFKQSVEWSILVKHVVEEYQWPTPNSNLVPSGGYLASLVKWPQSSSVDIGEAPFKLIDELKECDHK
jgi:hypothetical protein